MHKSLLIYNMISRLIILLSLCLSVFLPSSAHRAVKDRLEKDYWIEKYLSVSLPLDKIIITSSFGTRTDPFSGGQSHHSGIDLKAHYEEVLSMLDGYVIGVGQDSRSGLYVILEYGKYTISYCHLSRVLVNKGDMVFAGDAVAISGNTGRSTAPHLHITCKRNGVKVNPLDLIRYVENVRSEALQALHALGSLKLSRKEFFNLYAPAAMDHQVKYGIPASVTLAQMALESTWGTSDLARFGNNFFGIKATTSWLSQNLPYSTHDDDYLSEKFCNFSSPLESMEYHSKILMSNRYRRCWNFGPTDYHNWLVEIKAAGYATAGNYVAKCEQIILQNKLYLYDQLAEKRI